MYVLWSFCRFCSVWCFLFLIGLTARLDVTHVHPTIFDNLKEMKERLDAYDLPELNLR